MIKTTKKDITLEQVTEVQICDHCSEGEMVSTGLCLTCYPARYEHKCTKCNYTDSYTTTYPRTFLQEKK